MSERSRPACVATRLTPPGRGAVAVIAVEGVDAAECVALRFVSAAGKPLTSFPLDRIIFGRWEQSAGNGEEIVVCRTSETAFEVHCHGGVAAARAIMNAIVADGAIEQAPASWAARHSRDPIEAEAWLALTETRTERSAAILLDQYRGALRKALEAAVEELQTCRSDEARQRLAILLERGDIGLHLTKPWRVVLAGPPNVGKSSLMNRLLGYQRSIVFDQPGTTRDLLSAPTAFEGWSMELTDTAGLRESEDAIELEGVSRAARFLDEADLTVLVFDVTSEWGAEQEQLLARHPLALFVSNKCDLQDVRESDRPFIETSALTGTGVAELIQKIVQCLVRCELAPGDAVPFTSRQVHALDVARRAIGDGQIVAAINTLQTVLEVATES